VEKESLVFQLMEEALAQYVAALASKSFAKSLLIQKLSKYANIVKTLQLPNCQRKFIQKADILAHFHLFIEYGSEFFFANIHKRKIA